MAYHFQTGMKAKLPGPVPQGITLDELAGMMGMGGVPSRGSRVDTPGRISIVLDGTPVSKPRQTQSDKWKKRPKVVRYREWADRLRSVAGKVPEASSVASLAIVAYFDMPKRWSKRRRAEAIGTRHRVVPDTDNLSKAVMDALWKQDSAIADLDVKKRWGDAARIVIEIVTEADPC